jgi:hypothetical protein
MRNRKEGKERVGTKTKGEEPTGDKEKKLRLEKKEVREEREDLDSLLESDIYTTRFQVSLSSYSQ